MLPKTPKHFRKANRVKINHFHVVCVFMFIVIKNYFLESLLKIYIKYPTVSIASTFIFTCVKREVNKIQVTFKDMIFQFFSHSIIREKLSYKSNKNLFERV